MRGFKFYNPIREEFRIDLRKDTRIKYSSGPKSSAIRIVNVNDKLWDHAMALADDDALRIEVLGPEDRRP